MLNIKEYLKDKSIAIVSNSEILLKREYGQDIENNDIVIRFNHGIPKPKYLKNIGNRTDIWYYALNNQHMQLTLFNSFIEKPKHLIRFNNDMIHPDLVNHTLTTDPQYTEDCKKDIGIETYPTSGIFFFWYILNHTEYKEINLYGFDCFLMNNYINNDRKLPLKYHRPDIEREWLKKITDNNVNISNYL